MGVARFPQGRQRELGQQEGAADVDVLHKVIAFHVNRVSAGEVYRRGVVDHDVDSAKAFDGGGNCRGNVAVVADVPHERQRLAAGCFQLFGGREDRSLQLGVGFSGLGHDDDIGAVTGRAGGDCQADAAAAAGHQDGAALQ